MNRSLRPLLLAALLATAASVHAHGNVSCPAEPKEQWREAAELERKLTTEGWKVRKVKVHNQCYEVYGQDEKGARVEAFFNPRTFVRVAEEPKR